MEKQIIPWRKDKEVVPGIVPTLAECMDNIRRGLPLPNGIGRLTPVYNGEKGAFYHDMKGSYDPLTRASENAQYVKALAAEQQSQQKKVQEFQQTAQKEYAKRQQMPKSGQDSPPPAAK